MKYTFSNSYNNMYFIYFNYKKHFYFNEYNKFKT